MGISRRDFFKVSGGAVAGGALVFSKQDEASAQAPEDKLKGATETTTICPYCGVGCGFRVFSRDGEVIHIEGDLEHPINQGQACPKGASLYQLIDNETRVEKPMYRAPGATEWKEVEWDWILDRIAKKIKQSRDETFVQKNGQGQVVNRTEGIAHVGSAAMDNEECFIMQKWLRSLGLIYIEHQARI